MTDTWLVSNLCKLLDNDYKVQSLSNGAVLATKTFNDHYIIITVSDSYSYENTFTKLLFETNDEELFIKILKNEKILLPNQST